MVRIFRRFAHRHRNPPPPLVHKHMVVETRSETVDDMSGAEKTSAEFAPVEHPCEPPESDHPVRCPPPEPCIIHDGRLWKERLQLNIKRRKELPFMRESGIESTHGRRHTSEHSILPSMSAPANTILNLLDS